MPVMRRKKFTYKENEVSKIPKTSHTEMLSVIRAFLVDAIIGMWGGYAS